jgi:hypothetical protein
VLVREDDPSLAGSGQALAPDAVLGVTHCDKPEHAGPEGLLTHVCTSCNCSLLCRACSDGHLTMAHTVLPVEARSQKCVEAINAGVKVLTGGLTHLLAQSTEGKVALETLAANRATALETLAAAAGRLHAAVDAKVAALAADVEDLYVAKMAALHRGMAAARGGAAELGTVVAAAEVALGPSVGAVTRVHVAHTVQSSLELGRTRQRVCGPDASTLAVTLEEARWCSLELGRVVASVADLERVSALFVALCG